MPISNWFVKNTAPDFLQSENNYIYNIQNLSDIYCIHDYVLRSFPILYIFDRAPLSENPLACDQYGSGKQEQVDTLGDSAANQLRGQLSLLRKTVQCQLGDIFGRVDQSPCASSRRALIEVILY